MTSFKIGDRVKMRGDDPFSAMTTWKVSDIKVNNKGEKAYTLSIDVSLHSVKASEIRHLTDEEMQNQDIKKGKK